MCARHLDFDYKLGKIPEEDYPAQRSSLLQKGADLLRKIDALKESHGLLRENGKSAKKTQAKSKLTDEVLESIIAARRKSYKSSFEGFCP